MPLLLSITEIANGKHIFSENDPDGKRLVMQTKI